MTTPTLAPVPAVTEYARRVREQLADLDPDDVAELTEGMEADLVEALLETPGPADALMTVDLVEARFGSPRDYAAELRSAAGVPEAPAAAPRGVRALRARARARSRSVVDGLEAQPWWPGVRDLAMTMRPVWWVARAYALAMIGTAPGIVAPESPGRWFALVVILALSVQWGRGRLGRSRWTRRAGLAASVVALLVLPFAIGNATEPRYVTVESWVDPSSDLAEPGVFMDGEQIRSFHAYDAEGRPIEKFMLFDDRGRPVVTVADPGDEFYVGGSDESWLAVQPVDSYGRVVQNAFPLELGRWSWLQWDEADERWTLANGRTAFLAPRPFERAVPLAAHDGLAEGEEGTAPGTGSETPADTEPDEGASTGEPGDGGSPDGGPEDVAPQDDVPEGGASGS